MLLGGRQPASDERSAEPENGAPRESRAAGPTLFADPLLEFSTLIPTAPDRKVVILANKALRRQLRPWVSHFAGEQVHVLAKTDAPEWEIRGVTLVHHLAETDGELHWALKRLGPVDVIIDLTSGDMAAHMARWHRLFFHLRPGGAYLIDQTSEGRSAFDSAAGQWIAELLANDDPANKSAPKEKVEVARAVESIAASRDLVLVTKRDRHLVKLNDAETDKIMALREPEVAITELELKPAGELVGRCTVVSHDSGVPIPWLSSTLRYPPLHLRHYQGKVGFGGNTLMFTEHTILPDSFRHHLDPKLDNPRAVNVTREFARIPPAAMPKRRLEGDYYQIDCAFSGHFGHLMTETVSRLWGWDEAKRTMPGLKALIRSNVPEAVNPKFELNLFNAYGIDTGDVVWAEDPVWVDSIASASPMWHNQAPHYVHPEITATYDRIGERLIDWSTPRHHKIFVSRASRSPRRTCRNASDVENYFTERGFTVVYPETLPIRQQAGLFAQARVIAGFGGSALFNMMFAKNLKTLVLLSHEAYTARNEHLFASLRDCTAHYFWSPPDIPHPENGWSQAAFYSDWEFDFGRNAADLSEVLASC